MYVFAVIRCPAVTSIKGEIYNDAMCTSGKKVYNDTCEVSCTLGYNLTSIDGVHVCAEDGTWTNPVSCERKLFKYNMYIIMK